MPSQEKKEGQEMQKKKKGVARHLFHKSKLKQAKQVPPQKYFKEESNEKSNFIFYRWHDNDWTLICYKRRGQ
jgi:hypothetical protein